MDRRMKQKLLNSCLTALVVISSTLAPLEAKADTGAARSYTRIGGTDQYATAAAMARQGWPGTAGNVVLAAGMDFALVDALAAGPLASELKAPVLLTDGGNRLNSFAKGELERLKPQKVYITSGTAVIKPPVIEELKGMGITPVQLGGYDQYETSVNIAKELTNQGADVSQVVLAAGWLNPADALSVAPIAAAQGMPILTTTRDRLPASVQTYLDSIKAQVTDAYVVGGSAVVSETVKGQLPGTVSRYGGLTKYDTNLQILKNFSAYYRNDQVYVANGETLVDALAGVPLAAASGAPFVLVNGTLDRAAHDFLKSNISAARMVALGGEAVVPAAEMNALTSHILYGENNGETGSADAANPVKLTDNLILAGNNLTLKNARTDYSVYLQGDNITLNNVEAAGTVFIDPGDNGSAVLEGVRAAKLVILSGGKDSIHLNNTTADLLTIDSSSDVHVATAGTTAIAGTVVRSGGVIEVTGGSAGEVSILGRPGLNPAVELRGTFDRPVLINSPARVHLTASALVSYLISNAPASLTVEKGAKVSCFDNRGNAVEITGSGAEGLPASSHIDLNNLPQGPSAPAKPTTPTSPSSPSSPSTPTTPTAPDSVTVSNLKVITNPANSLGPFKNGAQIDLSGLDGGTKMLGFAVTADHDCTLQITALDEKHNISLTAGQEEVVTIGDLITGGTIPEVNLETLRLLYPESKTVQGKLIIDGKTLGTLTVKLKFK